jgi:hypothetical protein
MPPLPPAVLPGTALDDGSVAGIGIRRVARILPAERTTPAGRFVAERGRNAQADDVVWVDHDAAISMRRVRTGNSLERRAERLATPTIGDSRISYGCVNFPVSFYETFIQPIFAVSKAMVCVLPDTKPTQEVFDLLPAVPTGFDASGSAATLAPGAKEVLGDSGGLRRR